MPTPTVSVIIPCYNGARYIAKAVASLQLQSFGDFEIIVVDDGSTDQSAAIISELAEQDRRVRLARNERNLGLSRTRNRGLDESRAEFVAWLDCDDTAPRNRLQEQVTFFRVHPDFGLLGSWVAEMGEDGIFTGQRWILNAPADDFGPTTVFRSYCWQSAAMLRRSMLHGERYDSSFGIGEDYEFHARLSDRLRCWNLPKILCHYRSHTSNISLSAPADRLPLQRIFRARLARLGIDPSADELNVHQALFNVETRADVSLRRTEEWLLRLLDANKGAQTYPAIAFARVIVKQLLYASWAAEASVPARVRTFLQSRVLRGASLPSGELAKIAWETFEKRRLGGAPRSPHRS